MRLEKYREVLSRNPLFSGLDTKQKDDVISLLHGQVRTYEKGTFPHGAGEKFPCFGLVLSGGVQACRDDLDGNRMIMADVQPGVTFGESLCYLQIDNSPVYVYASEKSDILWLSLDSLFTASGAPMVLETRRRFAALLAQRTLAMNDRILILSQLTIREKLLVYFQRISRDNPGKTFTVPMSREDMATYIGANRAALSRELSRMKQDGLIEYQKNEFRLLRI